MLLSVSVLAGFGVVLLDQLRAALTRASPSTRVRIFHQATKLRHEDWQTKRKVMERVIRCSTPRAPASRTSTSTAASSAAP